MSIRLNYRIEDFDIRIEAHVPQGRMRSADLLPVHREVSEAITRTIITRTEEAGQKISCHKGCSACCKRLYVEVTDSEAYRLRDTIETLPEDHRKRVKLRFDRIHSQLVDTELYDSMFNLPLSDCKARNNMAFEYYEQGIACPFLEDNSCSIYNERPLACREYLVTSPAEKCARPKEGAIQKVAFPWQTIGHAVQMTQSRFEDIELVPLALLPSWLEQHPEPEPDKSGVELLMRSFNRLWLDLDTSSSEVDQELYRSTPGPDDFSADRRIVPDYAIPDALMVPHYGISPIELLENIAIAAARSTGVILLTPDPERTQAFIDCQPDPERFTMVLAASDTAWIRDREPIAVEGEGEGDAREWYLPRIAEDEREADASLFETICVHAARQSPFSMARGNLVTGPDGLALSTNLLLNENLKGEMEDMSFRARQLGIHRWIVFTPFSEEQTCHADVHVRFLSADIAAIAWNLSSEKDRQLANDLAVQLTEILPDIRILRIPIRSDGIRYGSHLNWIQLGSDLIVPRFELSTDEDILQATELLQNEGFNPVFIESPTLDTGGSLHCLTASIYL